MEVFPWFLCEFLEEFIRELLLGILLDSFRVYSRNFFQDFGIAPFWRYVSEVPLGNSLGYLSLCRFRHILPKNSSRDPSRRSLQEESRILQKLLITRRISAGIAGSIASQKKLLEDYQRELLEDLYRELLEDSQKKKTWKISRTNISRPLRRIFRKNIRRNSQRILRKNQCRRNYWAIPEENKTWCRRESGSSWRTSRKNFRRDPTKTWTETPGVIPWIISGVFMIFLVFSEFPEKAPEGTF